VLLVPFPFTDQSASKQRRGVIVSSAAYHRVRRDLVLMPITSQLRGSGAFGEVMVHKTGRPRSSSRPPQSSRCSPRWNKRWSSECSHRLSVRDAQALKEVLTTLIG
jgi:mRNA interferase MazF